jgi:hypothetical protein
MKKLFLLLTVAGFLTACNNSASTTDNKKDSIDSSASVKKDVVDSSASAKKDAIDSNAKAKKEMVDSLKKDSTRK